MLGSRRRSQPVLVGTPSSSIFRAGKVCSSSSTTHSVVNDQLTVFLLERLQLAHWQLKDGL